MTVDGMTTPSTLFFRESESDSCQDLMCKMIYFVILFLLMVIQLDVCMEWLKCAMGFLTSTIALRDLSIPLRFLLTQIHTARIIQTIWHLALDITHICSPFIRKCNTRVWEFKCMNSHTWLSVLFHCKTSSTRTANYLNYNMTSIPWLRAFIMSISLEIMF